MKRNPSSILALVQLAALGGVGYWIYDMGKSGQLPCELQKWLHSTWPSMPDAPSSCYSSDPSGGSGGSGGGGGSVPAGQFRNLAVDYARYRSGDGNVDMRLTYEHIGDVGPYTNEVSIHTTSWFFDFPIHSAPLWIVVQDLTYLADQQWQGYGPSFVLTPPQAMYLPHQFTYDVRVKITHAGTGREVFGQFIYGAIVMP